MTSTIIPHYSRRRWWLACEHPERPVDEWCEFHDVPCRPCAIVAEVELNKVSLDAPPAPSAQRCTNRPGNHATVVVVDITGLLGQPQRRH